MVSIVERRHEEEMQGVVIDPMTEHDLLEVVEIEESCGLSLWGWEAYRAELDRAETIMLVARRQTARFAANSRLSGFIAARVYDQEIHINNIGVRTEERRRGIGSRLLSRSLRIGAHFGARVALLEVRAGNISAQELYKAFGFIAQSRRQGYYRDPLEDALVMSRELESLA
jgi:ribosomal-protein-alanine N-acetyltransferase